jgi:16S rRNA (adenine1518-N6/adenine1519-N6)-dimethyltransferase
MTSFKPKRYLSQNFLEDEGYQLQIVSVGEYDKDDAVVELGPGYGALTRHLSQLVNCIQLIELDGDAIAHLKGAMPRGFAKFIQANILDVDLSDLGKCIRLIGNLPYHISSPILLHVDRHRERISDAIFMLQKEVVDRLVASPGDKAYGRLGIALQIHWDIEWLFDVPPNAFRPAPKVQSSVMCMRPRKNPPLVDKTKLDQILTTAFSKRRKTLRNALKGVFTEEDLLKCSIDPQARPENLSIDQYVQLANF